MRLAVVCASFHTKENLPCHFDHVLNIGTRLGLVRDLIAQRYDHTVTGLVLFQGEALHANGQLVQIGEALDMDMTLYEMGVEPVTASEAEEGGPTHTIYYDCTSTVHACLMRCHDQ